MKRLITLLFLLPLFLVFIGCTDEPTEGIDPPSAIQLEGATNETDLVLTWSPSSDADIDGYRIYFEGSEIWEGTATTYTHTSITSLGEYEITAYKGSDESDALRFDTEDYVNTGTFTVYDMDTPSGSGLSGVGFSADGVASLYSMASSESATNGQYVDFYYDNDGTFTSADYLGGDWVNGTGFNYTTSTYANLEVVETTGYSNATNPAIASGQVWQVVFLKNNTATWNYAKFRIDAVTTSPYVKADVTFAYQTIEGWARVD